MLINGVRKGIGVDLAAVDWNDPESRLNLCGAMTHFMREESVEARTVRGAMQNFGQGSDFPTSVIEILEKFNITPDSDLAYADVFDIRDMTTTRRHGFRILDVEDGLQFVEVPIGGKAKISKMQGSEITVNYIMYGGGLQWHRTLIDDEEYWAMEDKALAFRNQSAYDKATAFYALIDAIGSGYNLAWQAVTPANVANTNENYDAIRDINTINKACEEIVLALEGKGLGVSANSPFIVLAPLQLRGRMLRAMTVLNAGISGNLPGVHYTVSLRFTTMLSSSTVYYVCIPGIKSKGGIRMAMTIFDKFEIETYSDISVGWERYGGAIGEPDQFRRCSTS